MNDFKILPWLKILKIRKTQSGKIFFCFSIKEKRCHFPTFIVLISIYSPKADIVMQSIDVFIKKSIQTQVIRKCSFCYIFVCDKQ